MFKKWPTACAIQPAMYYVPVEHGKTISNIRQIPCIEESLEDKKI